MGDQSYKYLQPAEVGAAAAYRPTTYPSGVLSTMPTPQYQLPRISGLLNPGESTPVVTLADTPPDHVASLYGW